MAAKAAPSALVLRHEQQTVAAMLATVSHHSYPKADTAHDGLRAKKTVTSTREEASTSGVAARSPAGARAQGGAVTAAPAPSLAVPLLAGAAGEAVDARTLSFLLAQSVSARRTEEEEKEKEQLRAKHKVKKVDQWVGEASEETNARLRALQLPAPPRPPPGRGGRGRR